MRIRSLALFAGLLAASLAAQNQPGVKWSNGNDPNAGSGNAFPWGSAGIRYQQIIDSATIGTVPCRIQDIFVTADSSRGDRLIEHLDIEINMGRTPVPNANTQTNWDVNLPPANKTTVYRGPLAIFHKVGEWRGIGLPNPYVFLPLPAEPNLCIEIIIWSIKGITTPSNFYYPRSASAAPNERRAFRYDWVNNQTQAPLAGTGSSRLGVLCDNGNFVVTGTACGSLAMAGSPPAWPQINQPYTIKLAGAASNSPTLMFLGDRVLPPVDLTVIGMTNCTWYANPLVVLVTTANATGDASVSLPIPNLFGLRGYVQWLNLDRAANPFGLTASDMGTIIVGS